MKKSYNERLFNSGIRRWIHLARFEWLNKKCQVYSPSYEMVIELGCYDGRAIQYLPVMPKSYIGFDANWEGGVEMACKNDMYKRYIFRKCCSADEMLVDEGCDASLVISLETLEHVPGNLLIGYLQRISKVLNGYFIVTVPNEMGLVFLLKYLAKVMILDGGLLRGKAREYALAEIYYATICKMDMVERNEHKGFDWRKLQCDFKKYFDILEVEGVQFPLLPLWMNTQIGFVMRSKHYSEL
ncbi:hypothetical protein HGB13_04535 [bacterium]|nr:hypothetical protein [bacterium]